MKITMPLALAAATAALLAPANAHTLADTAASKREFSTLMAAVKAAGLTSALQGDGPLTVFAPTNDAFAKLPKATLDALLRPENREKLRAILTYHVVSGGYSGVSVLGRRNGRELHTLEGESLRFRYEGRLRVNDSLVVANDVLAENGVIHAIDTVLIPPGLDLSGLAEADRPDIVATAIGAGNFKTLVAAVKAAGLVETLRGDGPFTVFAPTDEAFAKLGAPMLAALLRPENRDKLRAILTYHVVARKVPAAKILRLGDAVGSAKTVQGDDLRIRVQNGKVRVDDATVLKTDVLASNGIIHVIDTVLMPPGMTLD